MTVPVSTAAGDPARAAAALERLVRDVPDFPEPGIVFKDITPLLADPAGLADVVAGLAAAGRATDGAVAVDKVVGMEARGFMLGVPVAQALGVGFVPVRKAGKLPRETHEVSYALEYGEATLALHTDGVVRRGAGARGRRRARHRRHGPATAELVERCGGPGARRRPADGAVLPRRAQRARRPAGPRR